VNHTRPAGLPYPPGVPTQHDVLVPEHQQPGLLGQVLAGQLYGLVIRLGDRLSGDEGADRRCDAE
jgi:hypothetical protein